MSVQQKQVTLALHSYHTELGNNDYKLDYHYWL